MKNIMLALSFSTFSAHAGPRTDYFDYNEKNRNVRCPVQVCAMDDYGRSYTQICRDLREMPSARGRLPVILLKYQRGQGCYCPCDYGYEARARAL